MNARESAFDSKYVANKWSDGILLNFISPTLCMHFTWKLAYAHYNWMVLLLLLPLGTLSIIKWSPNSYKLIALRILYIFMCCVIPASFHHVPPSIRTRRNSSLLVIFSTHPLRAHIFRTVCVSRFCMKCVHWKCIAIKVDW